MKAANVSSTRPATKGITLTPHDAIHFARGRDIAPQISVLIPSPANHNAFWDGSSPSISCSHRETIFPSLISNTSNRLEASKTGDILPSQTAIASLIVNPSSCEEGSSKEWATETAGQALMTQRHAGQLNGVF